MVSAYAAENGVVLGQKVVSRAVLIISGIREDGSREILGLKIGDTESFATSGQDPKSAYHELRFLLNIL